MGMAQRALIFGVTGQDGALLAQHLLTQGYELHGTSRRKEAVAGNLQSLNIEAKVQLHVVDPTDRRRTADLIAEVRPSEIYNLAGQSSVGTSFQQPGETIDSHISSTVAILEAIRIQSPESRFFHASSGEIFGETGPDGADEGTAIAPCNPYGAAKASATLIVKNYRDVFGLFACSGFLFNHESLLRPVSFVAQRVAHGAAAIKLRRAHELRLGNLEIIRDWGWAPDYVGCMARMLQHDQPLDTVIATGVATSLQSYVERVFSRLGLDWKAYVVHDNTLLRPTDVKLSVGNPAAAAAHLGWTAQVRMPEVADRLADAALARAGG